ncbi:Conserved_hypothetical protein [Hexamita inflata]|uniref:Uncharacterized protein n=1 Tax=Hexamita inflata TaxID=28002 RepID=A0ABP1H0K9_9EUKA
MDFKLENFRHLLKQELSSSNTLEDQVQNIIQYLDKTKPQKMDDSLNEKLIVLQSQYNSELTELQTLQQQLQQNQNNIQICQSPQMTLLLHKKQKLEKVKQLLKAKQQITQNFTEMSRIFQQNSVTEEQFAEIASDFVKINELMEVQAIKLQIQHIYDAFLSFIFKQHLQTASIPSNILSYFTDSTIQFYFECNALTLQNYELVLSKARQFQQSELVKQVTQQQVIKFLQQVVPNYEQLISLNSYFKQFTTFQIQNQLKSVTICSLAQKFKCDPQMSPSQFIRFIQNSPFTLKEESQILAAMLLLIFEQSQLIAPAAYTQIKQQITNAAQLQELITVKSARQPIINYLQLELKQPKLFQFTSINELFDLFELQNETQNKIVTEFQLLFEAVIYAFMFQKVKSLINGVNKKELRGTEHTNQLQELMQHLDQIDLLFGDYKNYQGKEWPIVFREKVVAVWAKTVGAEHCDLQALKK